MKSWHPRWPVLKWLHWVRTSWLERMDEHQPLHSFKIFCLERWPAGRELQAAADELEDDAGFDCEGIRVCRCLQSFEAVWVTWVCQHVCHCGNWLLRFVRVLCMSICGNSQVNSNNSKTTSSTPRVSEWSRNQQETACRFFMVRVCSV